ncbi:hypothetical protein FHE66_06160 [Georgenia sp. 311]|uniref:hypothetical protein n=1 Tax=Georgenia sp. 311 TaxID=2585134 RepID=UPI0011118BB7|nr:hypothetical protein [Georgenia sp. 311]TNC18619.1 hypothetical protein FHE66_06160 [Georgenia sp. 311]
MSEVEWPWSRQATLFMVGGFVLLALGLAQLVMLAAWESQNAAVRIVFASGQVLAGAVMGVSVILQRRRSRRGR